MKRINVPLHRLFTRQFLLYLFFVALSAGFWLFLNLNDTYEEEFDIHLELQGVPHEVVITDSLPQTIRVTLRDRGITLHGYRHGDTIPPLRIDFGVYANNTGYVRIPVIELTKMLQKQLAGSTQIIASKPEAVEYFYNYGRSKRVAVRYTGEVNAAEGYIISGQRLTPDTVTVYAGNALLDTLSAVNIAPVYRHGMTATAESNVPLQPLRGVKTVPATVKLTIRVDRLVEKRLTIPVTGVNLPEGINLRTFPPTVDVTCQVPMSLFNRITPDDFTVTTDYAALSENSTLCTLSLTRVPTVARFARLQTEEVEYVIEHTHP